MGKKSPLNYEREAFLLANSANRGTNSYSIIRIIAAILVVWTHSYSVVLGVDTKEPLRELTGYSLGSHAVHIFFTLSGFMVAASWERSRSLFDFILARALRIMPALVCVCLAIVILSGLLLTKAAPGEYWTVRNIGTFLAKSLLIFSSDTRLAGVFGNNPSPGEINASIWTIRYEVICYASLMVFMLLTGLLRLSVNGRRLLLLGILGVSATLLLLPELTSQSPLASRMIRLVFAFYIGVLAWFERDRVRLAFPYLVTIWVLWAISVELDSVLKLPLVIVATAYLGFWLGSFRAGWLQEAADRTDLSYGIYVSGFFIQQCLIQMFPHQGIISNAISAVLLSALTAWFSWNWIERPALQLRSTTRRRHPPGKPALAYE